MSEHYLVVCQGEHGENLHIGHDNLSEAMVEAKRCFQDCDCKPAVYRLLDLSAEARFAPEGAK